MHIGFIQVAAWTALIVGALTVWSNPARRINRFFASLSVHEALWLLSLGQALTSPHGLLWLRICTATGALIPAHLWLIKETIDRDEPLPSLMRRSVAWVLFCAGLAFIVFTGWFIPAYSTRTHPVYGLGYYIYVAGDILTYVVLGLQGFKQMRRQSGVRRLELQTFLLCTTVGAILVLILMGLGAWLRLPVLIRLQPLVILLLSTVIFISLTRRRLLDPRQLTLLLVQKVLLTALIAIAAFELFSLLRLALADWLALAATVGLSLSLAVGLRDLLDRYLRVYPRPVIAREALSAIAREEIHLDQTVGRFKEVLGGWGHCERVLIVSCLSSDPEALTAECEAAPEAIAAMRTLGWATPERLERERPSPERLLLGRFLAQEGLGVLVFHGGRGFSALVGVGTPSSGRPFTFPQVNQLIELSAVIAGALERAHLATKAQRAEQLATVGVLGASIAHEIRNPLVSIKTFAQLLPSHHADPAFLKKFSGLLFEEVSRIDRLTQQLMEMASPRTYSPQSLSLHEIVGASSELVKARAGARSVRVDLELEARPDLIESDASAVKQVVLNLCFNAIQAVESGAGERWIRLATRRVNGRVEMTVSDNGPGIAPEIRPRLFQTFQSTKSSGFGLGLAICLDILTSLNATLVADPFIAGRGATFRVTFPCPPS